MAAKALVPLVGAGVGDEVALAATTAYHRYFSSLASHSHISAEPALWQAMMASCAAHTQALKAEPYQIQHTL